MIPAFSQKRDQGCMKGLLDFIFPRHCLLCGTKHHLLATNYLCEGCHADFVVNNTPCGRCGIPMVVQQAHSEGLVCGQCQKSPPVYERCWSPFIYAQPLEWVIQQLKFNDRLSFAPLLSELMIQNMPASMLKQRKPDAIIPMPLHNKRLKQRGFNQSLLLAKPLASVVGVKIDSSSCLRCSNTEHQTGKSARQRKQNIKGAFKFDNHQNYRYLAIFDDVVTTGSSVSELGETLKKSGVDRVDVWSLARAEKYN